MLAFDALLVLILGAGFGAILFWLKKTQHKRDRFSPNNPAFTPYEPIFLFDEPPSGRVSVAGGLFGEYANRYKLDLGKVTCTCSTGKRRKGLFKRNDQRRLCRHLVKELSERGILRPRDEWSAAIIGHGSDIPEQAWILRIGSAPPVLVCKNDNRDWINLFAPTRKGRERIAEASGPLGKFGWNMDERRWAGGTSPPGGKEIRAFLIAATK